MKKILVLLFSCATIYACSNNGGESGAVDDGMRPMDSNGGLSDSPQVINPGTDTSTMEDRVDTEKRDSLNK
jgi:hypothetical protein